MGFIRPPMQDLKRAISQLALNSSIDGLLKGEEVAEQVDSRSKTQKSIERDE